MKDTIVIGGGISALAYLFFNPQATALVGNKNLVGGMFKLFPNFGPQYLWKDDYADHLLKYLRLPTDTRTVKVGVLHRGTVHTHIDTVPKGAGESYAFKTRGVAPKKSFMSGGHMEYEVYKVSLQEVIEALSIAVEDRYIPFAAKEIDIKASYVTDTHGNEHAFDKLVSTIPAPTFATLTGYHGKVKLFRAWDKYYSVLPMPKAPYASIRMAIRHGLDYIYCPESRVPYHRVTFFKDRLVYEFTNVIPGPQFTNVHKQAAGQIICGSEILKDAPKHIVFLGRYAQWDHSVKFNDVLKTIMEEK